MECFPRNLASYTVLERARLPDRGGRNNVFLLFNMAGFVCLVWTENHLTVHTPSDLLATSGMQAISSQPRNMRVSHDRHHIALLARIVWPTTFGMEPCIPHVFLQGDTSISASKQVQDVTDIQPETRQVVLHSAFCVLPFRRVLSV